MGVRVKGNDVETGQTVETVVEGGASEGAQDLESRVSDLETKTQELESRVAALEGAAP